MMLLSNSSKILKSVYIITTTKGWSATRQINHMDMAEQLKKIMNSSLMDNSIKDKNMDILEWLDNLVSICIKNGQMVNM